MHKVTIPFLFSLLGQGRKRGKSLVSVTVLVKYSWLGERMMTFWKGVSSVPT